MMDIEKVLDWLSPLPPLSRSPSTEPTAVFYLNPSSPSSIPCSISSSEALPSNVSLATLVQQKHLAPLAASGLILDCRSPVPPSELSAHLHAAGQAVMRLPRRGKVVVLSSPDDVTSSLLEGFVLALSKEAARNHTSVNLLIDKVGSEGLPDAVSFFLSAPSSFITGQLLSCGAAPAVPEPLSATALVTGAGGGIGRAIAEELARTGDFKEIVLTDHPSAEANLDATRALLGESAVALPLDITHASAPASLAAACSSPVAALVHAAGITADASMKRMPLNKFQRCMDINYSAIASVDDHFLEQGAFADGASVVLLSSVSGVAGNAGQVNYSTAKSGLLGYAKDRSKKVEGVAWNAIAPGFIDTDMVRTIPALNRVAIVRAVTSMKARGLPADVAAATRMLARGGGGFRGQCLRVCGGMLIGR